jgi:hypothetical protein
VWTFDGLAVDPRLTRYGSGGLVPMLVEVKCRRRQRTLGGAPDGPNWFSPVDPVRADRAVAPVGARCVHRLLSRGGLAFAGFWRQ